MLSLEFQTLLPIFMQSRRYLYVASRQGLCNTGELNPVCLRYIVVSVHMLRHVQHGSHELYHAPQDPRGQDRVDL
jgi:hypothetical protein